jgi:hypothetical protein
MTDRMAEAKEEADPCGMTARKAKAEAEARAKARAIQGSLHCAALRSR